MEAIARRKIETGTRYNRHSCPSKFIRQGKAFSSAFRFRRSLFILLSRCGVLYGYMHFLLCLSFFLSIPISCLADEFPYREFYPDVPVIELQAAKNAFDDQRAIFVDILSKMEFETIRLNDALNIDFSMLKYMSSLQKARKTHPGRKIIVYDNGINSLKSYMCVQDAIDAGIEDIYAYDGGIQAWAETYPGDVLLMGSRLTNPSQQLIPYDSFL